MRRGRAKLTVKERILLHLLEFTRYAESFDVPAEISQEGIAEGARIELRHLSQYLRPLLREGLVRERMAHVKGRTQRRKVYDLTDGGRMAAVRVREAVKSEVISVLDAEGNRTATVGEVMKMTGGPVLLLSILRQAMDSGTVDLTAPERGPSTGRGPSFVEQVADAPVLSRFIGRRAELDQLVDSPSGRKVFAVYGVAGIGKSSLAAKACELLRGRMSLFWHRVRPWDSRASILASLAEFLAALGRPSLRSVLSRSDSTRIDSVLVKDLPGIKTFLVFDDAHEATPEVLALFSFLKDTVSEANDIRLVVLSRRQLPFYDRRDVVLGRLVGEIDLGGLGAEEVRDWIGGEREGQRFVELSARFGGHPLSLELLLSAASSDPGMALRDIHLFMQEEIYGELSEGERTLMKTASLYQVPVPREALLSTPAATHDILVSLENRALLRPVGRDSYEVHETIRDFFGRILTSTEREELGGLARAHLRQLALQALHVNDFVSCINYLSNARRLLASDLADPELLELLADAYERIGDLPAALTAYREAVRAYPLPEGRARVLRKMASALEDRGDIATASEEIEAGVKALGGTPCAERGWLDLVRCGIAYRLADWEKAQDAGESALETLHAFDVPEGAARALLILGHIAMHSPQSDPALAETHLTRALELSAKVQDADFGADVRIALAHLLAWHMHDLSAAIRHVEAIEESPAAMKLPQVRRKLRLFQGMFRLVFSADYATAEASFRSALEEGQRICDAATIANAKVGLGYSAYFQGRFEDARRFYEEAAAELKPEGLIVDTANLLLGISEAYFLAGDQPASAEVFSTLMSDPSLARAAEARSFYTRLVEGYLYLFQGDRDEAFAALADAVSRATAKSGIGEGTMTYDFVACISWPAIYALVYSGVALRFLGRKRDGDAQILQAGEIASTSSAKAWLDAIPRLERRITEVLGSILGESAD